MTIKLYWDGGLGGMRLDNTSAVLRTKPALPFDFVAVLLDDERAVVRTAAGVRDLTAQETEACRQHVRTHTALSPAGAGAFVTSDAKAAEALATANKALSLATDAKTKADDGAYIQENNSAGYTVDTTVEFAGLVT